MKFTLILSNDNDKVIKSHLLETWYGDDGLKKEINSNGIETLETIANMLSLSIQQEMDDAVKTLLFVMQEDGDEI